MRGVDGVLEMRTRCLGVIVIFPASASWCRGVWGVANGLDLTLDCLLVFVTEKWALILLGEGVEMGCFFEARSSVLDCIAGEEFGLKNGFSFSLFPKTRTERRFARVWTPVASVAVHPVSLR